MSAEKQDDDGSWGGSKIEANAKKLVTQIAKEAWRSSRKRSTITRIEKSLEE